MNIKELIERRNRLMTEAQALITKETVTTEDRSNFDRMIADSDVMSADITRMQSLESFNAEQRNSSRPPRASFGTEDQSDELVKNQKRAFKEWFRTGQVSPENRAFIRTSEQRDLGTGAPAGSISGGGVLVPTGFDPVLHQAEKNFGQIVSAVSQLTTSNSGPIQVATSNDTNQGMTVIGQAVAVSENDPTFAGFTSNTDTLTSGLIRISAQLVEDSEFDLDSYIQSAFGTRYYRGLSQMISQGNGSNIAALGSTLGATSKVAESVQYQDLAALFGSLDASYTMNANWLMSSQTRAYLMGLISTTGQPVLQTDVAGNPFNQIFGKSIVISEFQEPVATGNSPILFGDLKSAYVLRQSGGFAIKRLTELFALSNELGYVMYARAGGYNLNPGVPIVRSLLIS